jgi:hypothetical protein
MSWLTRVIFVSMSLGSVVAHAQATGDRFEDSAQEFVNRLGRSDRFQTVERNEKFHLFSVDGPELGHGPDYSVTVDMRSGDVIMWQDFAPSADPMEGSTVVVTTQAQAWQRAEDWAKKANISLPPRLEMRERTNMGRNLGYTALFHDKINGVLAGAGNQVMLNVNRYTGQIAFMSRSTGYTYDPVPSTLKSEDSVKESFRQAIRRVYGVEASQVEIMGKSYGTSGAPAEGPLADPARPDTFSSKRSRLVFRVKATVAKDGRTDEVVGSVDAATGMVLNGGLTKGGSSKRASGAVRQAGAQQSNPVVQPLPAPAEMSQAPGLSVTWLLVLVSGATAALAMTAIYLLRR